jgi:N-acetylglucosamine-6-phosphate deacetylase
MTIAPELPNANAVAKLLRKNGVTVALGHTNTDYETASRALKGDYVHVTHTFNAQSSFDHRAPGVFGAVLSSDFVTAELIADAVHVHPAPMKVLIRSLGTDRVVIITDAMTGAGLKEGTYSLAGNDVTVKDGRATLQNGTLAGSIATLNQCVRNVHQLAGYPLQEAVKMASLNPARAMGLGDRLGTIQPRKFASLTVIDEDVNVYLTMVKGKIVYNNL